VSFHRTVGKGKGKKVSFFLFPSSIHSLNLFSLLFFSTLLNANVFNDATKQKKRKIERTVNEPLNIKQFIKTRHKKEEESCLTF
jgi:hypothetical protein